MDAPPVEVFMSFQFNNLLSISELEGTATLDFFWRLYWIDPRLKMPSLWDALNDTKPVLLNTGIELKNMVRSNTLQLNLWLPDLFLVAAKEVDFLDESIRLRPGVKLIICFTFLYRWPFI